MAETTRERILPKQFPEIKCPTVFVIAEPNGALSIGGEEKIKKIYDSIDCGQLWKREDGGDHFKETLIEEKTEIS